MTKQQKLRRNSFAADFNAREEDFILADLNVAVDEEELSPVQLNHFMDDEDVTDRLLIGANDNVDDELELVAGESDVTVIDDISLADELADSDEIVIELLEQAEQNRDTEIEEIPVSDFHPVADFDEIPAEEDAIDRLLVDAGFDANDELEQDDRVSNTLVIDDISRANEFGVTFEEQNAMTADADFFDSGKTELAIDKDATDVFLVKEENLETAKKEQTISETNYPEEALESLNNDAGITKLRAIKCEQENIKKQINDYENKVKKASIIAYTSLSIGIVALLSTIVMGVIVSSVQPKVSKLTELVSILEEDMGSIAEKNSDMEINTSIEPFNQKVNGLQEERSEEQILSSSDISENEMTADVTKQAAVNKSPDNLPAKPPAPEKKKPSAAAKKPLAEKNAAGWFINLTAYEDPGYAKSKAEKFLQQGIPVKVIAVNMNNTTWYRLKVGGFKSKEEATSHAAKIKKSLNLNSVSVGNN